MVHIQQQIALLPEEIEFQTGTSNTAQKQQRKGKIIFLGGGKSGKQSSKQLQIHQTRKQFDLSKITQFFLKYICLYNNLMNFSNFVHSLYQIPYYYESVLFQYPYMGYILDNPLPVIEHHENFPLDQTSKSEKSLKERKWKIIEEQLRKSHFQSERHRKIHWTAEQDKLLERLVQVQKLEWKQIPQHFSDRTQNMCYSRYRRISMCTKDRNWSKIEEEVIVDLVNQYGEKWKLISSKMPKFTPKQIRERYLNYLRPNINKDDFTFEEDLKICKYVLEHGKHWRKMEKVVQGRSEGCIKGRYYGTLRKIIQFSLSNQAF